MLFSKANLSVLAIASKDPAMRAMTGVHFADDGSTIGTNGKMLMAVEPVDPNRVHFPDVGEVAEPVGGVTVPAEIVAQATKNLPADKRSSLQHVAMTRCDDRKVEFTSTDMTKEQRVAGAPMRDKYPSWRDVLRKAKSEARSGSVCLNRGDLRQMLDALEKSCPDPGGESPVFIEFGGEHDGIIMRSANYETGQHAVGFVMPLDTGGKWLKLSAWERRIFLAGAKRRKS